MKIAHWTLKNGSGLHMVAEELCTAERALGYDSVLQNSQLPSDIPGGMGRDIHVCHSHIPTPVIKAGGKIVWCGHGTPEHTINTAMLDHRTGKLGDSCMLNMYWLQHADARVTFVERHQDIYQRMADKHTVINYVPLGINTDYWKIVPSKGKYIGNPSAITAENSHFIKWAMDLCILWDWVIQEVPTATLHLQYIPQDQHRWFMPLIYRNGCAFASYISGVLTKPALRNAFVSCDYYINMVRYGDPNRVGMEAKASGCKVISYRGNPYADYWLTEGDQRVIAQELIDIFTGKTPRRESLPTPNMTDTAKRMIQIYENC